MGRPKFIQYISTLGIFSALGTDKCRIIDEEHPIDHEKHPTSHGYAASKWVGEKLLMIASERGIPCNIFRLGLIWADTQSGRYDEPQREYRILKTCLLSGCGIEDYQFEMAPTPVDYAVRSIVYLASQDCYRSRVFHICSSNHETSKGGLFERCNDILGEALKLVARQEWVSRIRQLHEEGQSLPALPLLDYMSASRDDSLMVTSTPARGNISFDCGKTHRELERAGIVCPVFNGDLLKIHLDDLLRRDVQLRTWAEARHTRNFRYA
jgi:thioester reductase-like protein